MVNFKLPAVLLTFGLASTVLAAAVRDRVPLGDVAFNKRAESTAAATDPLPRAVVADDGIDGAAMHEFVSRQTDYSNKLSYTITQAATNCRPHVTNIQKACKGSDANAVAIAVKLEINAIIVILVQLLADLKAVIALYVGVKIEASIIIAALTALIQILVDIIVAIRGCVNVSLVILLLKVVLAALCTAFVNIFVALEVSLIGLFGVCGGIAVKLGLSLAILVQLGLNCLLAVFF